MIDTDIQLPVIPEKGLASGSGSKLEETARIAKEFEVLLMGQAVEQMMQTVDFGAMSGGFGEDMWRSFLSNSIAEKIVENSGIGIAGNIEDMLNAYGQ